MTGPRLQLQVGAARGPRRDHLVVEVSGMVDRSALAEFDARLAGIGRGRLPVVVLDLSAADSLCAGAVRSVDGLREALQQRGGGLLLTCAEDAPAGMLLRALGVPVAPPV